MLPALPQQEIMTRAIGAERVALCDARGRPVGTAVVLRRWGVGAVVRGPVWGTDAIGARVDALRGLRRQGVRLMEPDGPCPATRESGFRRLIAPQGVAETDLAGWDGSRLGVKFRQKVGKAGRAGVTVAAAAWDGAPHWLIARAAAQARDRGYRGLPDRVLAAIARATPGAATIWTGAVEGNAVAGMLILRDDRVATYQVGWTGDAGRTVSAHHLMLATICERLADDGVRRLDLGRVEPDRNPGLAAFKRGAGATFRELGGSWVAVPGLRSRPRRGPTLRRAALSPAASPG